MESKQFIEQQIKELEATRDYLASQGKNVKPVNDTIDNYKQVLLDLEVVKLFRRDYKKLKENIVAATNAYDQAKAELKKLNAEWGDVKINNLPVDVRDKYKTLCNQEAQAFREIIELQNKQYNMLKML